MDAKTKAPGWMLSIIPDYSNIGASTPSDLIRVSDDEIAGVAAIQLTSAHGNFVGAAFAREFVGYLG